MAPSRRRGQKGGAASAASRRQWKVGDLVLAKVKGFQAWPAMVSEPEKWGYAVDSKKVLVCFFGTQQIAFCNPADVEAFTEEKKQYLLGKRHGKYSEFGRALVEIIDTFEKLKKQDEINNANNVDEDNMVSENNEAEIVAKSISSDISHMTTSQLCQNKILSSGIQSDANVRSLRDADDTNSSEGLSEKEVPSKEVGSDVVRGERRMVTTYSTRRRSERAQASKSSVLRRLPSGRPSRSSSRVDSLELQNVEEPFSNFNQSIEEVASGNVHDISARRSKRTRKTHDVDDNEVDSPDVVSNLCAEGNDSGILTGDSDALSLNEANNKDCDSKGVQPGSVTDLGQPDIEFSQRLDFQANTIIHKKKRKPKRKRPSKASTNCPDELVEKRASDSDVVKSETILRSDHERSPEKCSREDGDEHLPLLKRARVRMGPVLSTSQQNTSQDSEEKPQEVSHTLSDQVSPHLHGDLDGSTDQESLHDNGDLDKPSTPHKLPENHQLQEDNTTAPCGSSVDVEAALPPSKRLHRALEAMSAYAAEDNKKSVNGVSSSVGFGKFTERKTSNELRVGKEEEFCDNNSPDGPLELPSRPDNPVVAGVTSVAEITQISGDNPRHEPRRNGNCCLDSSFKETKDADADEDCSKSLSPGICEKVDSVTCGSGSPCVAMPSDNRCKVVNPVLPESFAITDPERSQVTSDVISGNIVTAQAPCDGTDIHMDSAHDSCKTTRSSDLIVEDCKDLQELDGGNNVVESEAAEKVCGPSSSLTPSQVIISQSNGEDPMHSGYCDAHLARSSSISDDHSLDKAVSVSQSSSSLTDGLDSVSHPTPHTLAGNTSASDNISVQFNGSCSPSVHSRVNIQKRASKWNSKEAQANLASFGAILGTLTRNKETIGRATRIAIDCAKYGVAAKVVESLASKLERESSLHKRVDLFFLVDSIAQCSKGLKGDVAGVYPSAILALLPRLLSAAAPPGSSSQENRKQCLKVLRVWLERRILPESIVRHHIRELDSLCGSSCSRVSSRRPFRNERAFDDPVREMEGMLVDEYGSNSSFQLPGFCMPPMLRDEDNGVDSDGESFEAVTPEHGTEMPEVERESTVQKHRHILEDVDGELEMEDVAPSEGVTSASNIIGANGVVTSNLPVGNGVAVSVVPPLPEDVPPASPPLPTSPPPPPPLPPLPPPSIETDSITKNPISRVYTCSQVQSQLSNPATCSSFGNAHVSHPQIQGSNKNAHAEGTFDKGFRLRPPHPAPSNQFSYVQNQRLQSRRDIPPSSHSSGFHIPNAENGNIYRDRERMKFGPHGVQECWRSPQPFPGANYPDACGVPYTPAAFTAQHCEPSRPNHRWGFPSRPMNHQEFVRHGPPSGGPIPVSARGANLWRPT